MKTTHASCHCYSKFVSKQMLQYIASHTDHPVLRSITILTIAVLTKDSINSIPATCNGRNRCFLLLIHREA